MTITAHSQTQDLFSILAPTIRVGSPLFKTANNLGLECYLGEALIKANFPDVDVESLVRDSALALIAEGQPYRSHLFWGWEKAPSIPDISFPLDWDDSSKAIDFLRSAVCAVPSLKDWVHSLPTAEVWKNELTKSFFEIGTVGEDIVLPCPRRVALSVFFGDKATALAPRDDPMVTVTTVRTTKSWFPSVAEETSSVLRSLLDRAAFVMARILSEDSEDFESYSRYYFSFGHFVYRFIETLLLLGYSLEDFEIDRVALRALSEKAYFAINGKSHRVDAETIWWFLIGLQVGWLDSQPEVFNYIIALDDVPIYRHRRTQHYYFAKGWTRRILYFELAAVS